MTTSNRYKLKAKINKSNEIMQTHHIKRTLSERQNIIQDFRNKVNALKNQIQKNQIEPTEKQMQTNPASLTEDQCASRQLGLEHCEKLDIVAGACNVLKVFANDLLTKHSPQVAASKILEGISILNNIIDTVNNICTAKADIVALQNVSSHITNNKKLSKYEKKLLDDITKYHKKLSKAETLKLITQDKDICKEYVAKGEAVLLKRYREYYTNIIGENIDNRINKQRQSIIQPEKKNKAAINIFKFIDTHFSEQADILKSILKEPVKFLDNQNEGSDYWENSDNIVKFLKLLANDKFKYHFKSLVNTKFNKIKTILDGAIEEKDKKSLKETQSSAVKSVMREYGFCKTTDPIALVKLIEPLFKGKNELRLLLSNQLEQYGKKADSTVMTTSEEAPTVTVTDPTAKSEPNLLDATNITEKNPVIEIAPKPIVLVEKVQDSNELAIPRMSIPATVVAPSLPLLSKNTSAFFSPKLNAEELDEKQLVSKMVDKLREKIKELTHTQQDPATSPQLKKHNSGHIVSLNNTLAKIEANRSDIGKIRDVIQAEIQDKYHVNVVLRNILETFVKQVERFLAQARNTLTKAH